MQISRQKRGVYASRVRFSRVYTCAPLSVYRKCVCFAFENLMADEEMKKRMREKEREGGERRKEDK